MVMEGYFRYPGFDLNTVRDLGRLNFIRLLRVGSCIIPSVRGENDAEQSDEVQARIRENAKYLDGKQDLTATREAGFTKIWARDAGIFLPLCREFEQSYVLVAPGNQPLKREQ